MPDHHELAGFENPQATGVAPESLQEQQDCQSYIQDDKIIDDPPEVSITIEISIEDPDYVLQDRQTTSEFESLTQDKESTIGSVNEHLTPEHNCQQVDPDCQSNIQDDEVCNTIEPLENIELVAPEKPVGSAVPAVLQEEPGNFVENIAMAVASEPLEVETVPQEQPDHSVRFKHFDVVSAAPNFVYI